MAITTNREYLTALLSRFGLVESDIDLIVVEYPELKGVIDVKACKLAIYKSMSVVLPTAKVSEGDYNISWDLEALKLWYASLCNELGKPNLLKPQIRNRSNHW